MQNENTPTEGTSSAQLEAESALRDAACSRCIVHGCVNHRHQGRFIGDLCKPCHNYITTGRVGPTTSFLGKLDGLLDALKTISVSDWKTAGELRKMARDAYSSANAEHVHPLPASGEDEQGDEVQTTMGVASTAAGSGLHDASCSFSYSGEGGADV